MYNLSIKRKLMLIIMGVSTVALLLASAGFIAYELFAFKTATRQDLSTLADVMGSQSSGALTIGYEKDGEEILSSLRAKQNITAAALYKPDGEVFATYRAPGANNELIPSVPQGDVCRFEKDHVVVFKHIRYKGDLIGAIYLKSDLEERNTRLKLCAATIGLLMLLSTGVTFALSSQLQRIVTRPIFHLVQTAKAVSAEKNYSVRARKHGEDELGQLIDGFNEMLSQIQQRDAALQSAHDDLEKRVQERTQDLQLEIAERRRAEAALQEQFTRTSLLNQITQVISERQDLESILYVVLRQLEDHLAVDLGIVCIYDRATDALNVAALRVKNPLLAAKLDLREGMVLHIEQTGIRSCKHGEVVNIADTLKAEGALPEKLAVAGFRASLAVPLVVENKLFGVMLVARLNTDSIRIGERDFLRTLSKQVALAAHQAQLHAELEKAYNDLRQTQQTVMQQERLKALGQMASGIAHDVNNALSPVVGFSDLLIRGEAGISDHGKKYLEYIKTAGEDIAHIVARLREFYRRRDEGETLQLLDVNALVKQVIDMTRPRWRDIPQGRGIMVEVREDLDAQAPELVGIKSEIREAVTNLIINAVDAIPNGGAITVRTRVASWTEAQFPAHVIVEVSDNGIGMDEETRKRCLEPFFSTKGKRGTGLGLAMVYGVMERHEGKIEVDSELGKGTTMRLIFPVRKLANPDGSEAGADEPTSPLRILCIDDEPLVRELLKEMLGRDGHHVHTCDGGQVGVDAFRTAKSRGEPFDVVITDLGMPYFDGRQVAKVVKRESPNTPVVMLTGWGAFMKENDDMPAQVDGVLSKPPRSAEIRQALRRVVQEQKRLTDQANANKKKTTTMATAGS
jgi:signal transduction histidine kinase/FixJ family two-component response regulator